MRKKKNTENEKMGLCVKALPAATRSHTDERDRFRSMSTSASFDFGQFVFELAEVKLAEVKHALRFMPAFRVSTGLYVDFDVLHGPIKCEKRAVVTKSIPRFLSP